RVAPSVRQSAARVRTNTMPIVQRCGASDRRRRQLACGRTTVAPAAGTGFVRQAASRPRETRSLQCPGRTVRESRQIDDGGSWLVDEQLLRRQRGRGSFARRRPGRAKLVAFSALEEPYANLMR